METKAHNDGRNQSSEKMVRNSIELCRQGLWWTAETQLQMLNFLTQRNAETADLWRSMLQNVPGADIWLDLAEHSVSNLIDMRRQYLEFVERQNA